MLFPPISIYLFSELVPDVLSRMAMVWLALALTVTPEATDNEYCVEFPLSPLIFIVPAVRFSVPAAISNLCSPVFSVLL